MKVLVVEDDADIQDLAAYLLRRAGHEVLVAGTGETGLAIAVAEHPDLVVLDWMMPGLSGVEVCQALRADPRTDHIPVLMLTSRTQEDDIHQAFTVGADDYMVKPFRGSELVSRVKAMADRGR